MKPSTAQPSRFFQVTLGCFPQKTTSPVHVQASQQGFYSIPNMGVPNNKQMNFYWGWFISHIVVSVVVSGFHQDNPNDQMPLKMGYLQKNAIPKSKKKHGKSWLNHVEPCWIQRIWGIRPDPTVRCRQGNNKKGPPSSCAAFKTSSHRLGTPRTGRAYELCNCASTDLNKPRKYVYIYIYTSLYIYIYKSEYIYLNNCMYSKKVKKKKKSK